MKVIYKVSLFLFLCCLGNQSYAQILIERISNMVKPISNNAVAIIPGLSNNPSIYSFAGIDSTKIYSGVTINTQVYDVATDIWMGGQNMPTLKPTIAGSAAAFNNILYYFGGYTVLVNGNELSNDEVIRFDFQNASYLSNGSSIPTPIDDHVQIIRNNLAYLITGWSNTTNVSDVQVYDMSNDTWSMATPVPNGDYRAFGASGAILGDTIYYAGGAKIGTNFPLANHLRKGAINPNDPLDITWSVEDNDLAGLYRSACFTHENKIYWIGGSTETYNFNGLAYAGNTPVEPQTNLVSYDPKTGQMEALNIPEFTVMDLRSIVSNNDNTFYIAGGMEPGQKVSAATYKITMPITTSVKENTKNTKFNVFPNPSNSLINILPNDFDYLEILDTNGRILSKHDQGSSIDISSFNNGALYVKIVDGEQILIQPIIKAR